MGHKAAYLVRTDLGMGKGKIAAQVAHAAVMSTLVPGFESQISSWLTDEPVQTKIVLKIETLEELMKLATLAREQGINVTLVHDAGHTQVEPGTVTVLGLGPDEDSKIEALTQGLKLL